MHVFDGDVKVVLVKVGSKNRVSSPSRDAHNGALASFRAQRTGRYVLRDNRFYAGQAFGAQKQLLNSCLLI